MGFIEDIECCETLKLFVFHGIKVEELMEALTPMISRNFANKKIYMANRAIIQSMMVEGLGDIDKEWWNASNNYLNKSPNSPYQQELKVQRQKL